VAAFVAAWRAPAPGSPPPPALTSLLRRLGPLATLPGRLHRSGLDADLVDEAMWPLVRVSAEVEAAPWSLLRLAEPPGSAGDRELAAMAAIALARSQASRFSTGTGLPELVRWAATAERPVTSRRARAVVDAMRCVPEVPWPRRWFEGARSTEVFGVGDDGRPRFAGRHRVVAFTTDGADGAWGVAIDDMVCAPP
jgi:hypothetical protein